MSSDTKGKWWRLKKKNPKQNKNRSVEAKTVLATDQTRQSENQTSRLRFPPVQNMEETSSEHLWLAGSSDCSHFGSKLHIQQLHYWQKPSLTPWSVCFWNTHLLSNTFVQPMTPARPQVKHESRASDWTLAAIQTFPDFHPRQRTSVSNCSSCPMKARLGEMTWRRCFTKSKASSSLTRCVCIR